MVEYCQNCGNVINNRNYWITDFDESKFCSRECAQQAAWYVSDMVGYKFYPEQIVEK